jgi:hypothetical protein
VLIRPLKREPSAQAIPEPRAGGRGRLDHRGRHRTRGGHHAHHERNLTHAARFKFRYTAPMKILTDDPDWARDIYEARALAMMFVGKHGCPVDGGACLQAVESGLKVSYYPNRCPVRLTIDAPGVRVLSVEWKIGDAWRVEIETYHHGRWQSRLKAAVYPRPWLERWRAVATFTWSLPRSRAA